MKNIFAIFILFNFTSLLKSANGFANTNLIWSLKSNWGDLCFQNIDWSNISDFKDKSGEDAKDVSNNIFSCLNEKVILNKNNLSHKLILEKVKQGKEICDIQANLQVPESIKWEQVSVLTEGFLNNFVKSELKKTSQYTSDDPIVKIIRFSPTNLSCRDLRLSIDKPLQFEAKNFVRIYFESEKVHSSLSLGVEFSILRKVPVLNKNLFIGDRVSSEDWILSEKDITFKNQVLTEPESFEGRALSRGLSAGQFITSQDLKREYLVEKSQMVKVKMMGSDFEISSQATAEASGYLGDYIKLKNPDSQKIFAGTIIGKGLVEVK